MFRRAKRFGARLPQFAERILLAGRGRVRQRTPQKSKVLAAARRQHYPEDHDPGIALYQSTRPKPPLVGKPSIEAERGPQNTSRKRLPCTLLRSRGKMGRAKPDVNAPQGPWPPGTDPGPPRPHPAVEMTDLSEGEALALTPSPTERRYTL